MPREIVLGNGEMLVNLDGTFQIRDLYFPYVGWANHVGGYPCRVGVWAEGAGFAWLDASWDLWEERRGCHVWTVASVIAALRSAGGYARAQGEPQHAARYDAAAQETLDAFQLHFWDEEAGRYARMVSVMGDGALVKDMTVDSSASALFLFGVLPPDDARLAATMHAVGRALWVRAPVGGLARYERDPYFRVSDDFAQVPGNPWIICTLWLADWYCATAKIPADLRPTLDLLDWAAKYAMPTGVLAEQVHPFTGAPLSVAPLTWSHAQFMLSVSAYLDALKRLA